MTRDYLAEMRKLLDDESETGDPAPLIGARLADRLRREDPELLAFWLDLNAASIIRDAVSEITRSARAHARAVGARAAFARSVETGDVTEWLHTRYTLADGRRPVMADLTADDLTYVATTYTSRARENLFEAAFCKALAAKVGRRTVGEVFTEEKIVALRRGLAA